MVRANCWANAFLGVVSAEARGLTLPPTGPTSRCAPHWNGRGCSTSLTGIGSRPAIWCGIGRAETRFEHGEQRDLPVLGQPGEVVSPGHQPKPVRPLHAHGRGQGSGTRGSRSCHLSPAVQGHDQRAATRFRSPSGRGGAPPNPGSPAPPAPFDRFDGARHGCIALERHVRPVLVVHARVEAGRECARDSPLAHLEV